MNERSYVFGRDGHLVGICTEPTAEKARPNAPALLLLNAGIIHRVGPFRFYVDLARLMAKNGYTVFRADLSGIGDSSPSKDNRPEHERIMADIAECMDLLTAKRGIKTFVLSGLCWGADMSHDCAVIDARVTGAVLLDSYGYPTMGFFLRDRLYPLLKLSKWACLVKRMVINRKSVAVAERKNGGGVFNRQFPSREEAVIDLKGLIARKVKLLFIYSGGVPVYYNYAGQFRDMFKGIDFSGCVESVYFKEADHLFGQLAVRRKMFGRVLAWYEKNFSA